ncbi:hypothetical protein [Halobellus clavatus]|jgi:hypothetical protein|uniref:Uncharacterized protein n=1 Tax=Halobellus clavatus TaxID=660517 RepID=A0A1H3F4H8_9EURY|nr:hypothetical protein [Halobellus clavatus]SDX85825.1 hypothetical protein SAMN04487946_103140 [Halobellus clavatus]
MALPRPLPDEFRLWYLLDVAAFVVGVWTWLQQSSTPAADLLALDPFVVSVATVSGLLAVFILRVTVGNLWGYAVEYANAGGEWTDLPFLATLGIGVAAGIATYVVTASLGAAAWTAFWAFVFGAIGVGVVVHLAAGYRESSA